MNDMTTNETITELKQDNLDGHRQWVVEDGEWRIEVGAWLLENVCLYDEAARYEPTGNVVPDDTLARVLVAIAAQLLRCPKKAKKEGGAA